MFEALKIRLQEMVREWIPTRSVTRFNTLAAEAYRASGLSVDSLHDALRQAEGGDVTALFAIYRDTVLSDSHVQSEFSKRKLAIIGDTYSFLPANKKKPQDVQAAAFIEGMIENVSGWLMAESHLMDSVLWPVSVLEKVFKPSGSGYTLDKLVPVPHDLLDFRSGHLKIKETDANGYPSQVSHDPDPRRYIIHRNHLLTTADHWGGPMRSILFWWLLGGMGRDWWARFLDRYGSAFMVGKYEQSDDASRMLLERAFSAAVKIGGLVISKETEVEIKQASTQSNGEAFAAFYTISRREISKLIVGQTLSSEAQSTGLGSGVADAQGEVRDDYRKFDGKILGETLRDQLFRPVLIYNGVRDGVPKISWGSVSPVEAKATGDLLTSISQAGLRVADSGLDALSERVGLPIERAPSPAAALPGVSLPLALAAYSASTGDHRLNLADASIDTLSRNSAASLAQGFRGVLAPVRQLVLDSTSAEDLEKRILAAYSDWPAGKVAGIIESALVAFAANGVTR